MTAKQANQPIEEQSEETSSQEGVFSVETRFGSIHINSNKSVFFPGGLLGMPEFQYFCMAPFPNGELPQFAMLQSTENLKLTFLTLPLPLNDANFQGPFIKPADLAECKEMMHLTDDNMLVTLIATLHHPKPEQPENVQVSVNLRAPLVINTDERIGIQYVFEDSDYPIRFML